MKYEHMLHEPTVRPKERALFKKAYMEEHVGFEAAMATACRNIALKNEVRYFLHVQDMRRCVSRLVTSKLKAALRKK